MKKQKVTKSKAAATVPRAKPKIRLKVVPASTFMMHGGGGYSGASNTKRSLKSWDPLPSSADTDILPDLRTLRARSRDLMRNSPVAGGAVNGLTTNVVGTGLSLQAALDQDTLGITPEQATEWQRRAEQLWFHWCCRSDIRRRQHFTQMQEQIFRGALESGDILVIRRHKLMPGDLLGLKLQLVEADRISTPPDKLSDPRILDGIQTNKDGATVAFFVSNRHPTSLVMTHGDHNLLSWSRVMMLGSASRRRQVLHIGDLTRPGQTRGVPFLAPVIELIKQLERYTEAEIAAAVIASFFTVFTKSEAAEGLANTTLDPDATEHDNVRDTTNDLELGPAMINDLLPGEDIVIADPKRPNTSFEPFVQAVLGQIGMRLEIPYEVLVKQFKASYSAARAAMLEARRLYTKRRHWLSLDLCNPVYEWVIEEAILRGYLDAPGFDADPLVRQAWLRALWVGNAFGHVDPQKEIGAFQLMKEEGWVSDSEAVQELRGTDFRDVVTRRQTDALILEDADLTPEPPKVEGDGDGDGDGDGEDKPDDTGDEETGDEEKPDGEDES